MTAKSPIPKGGKTQQDETRKFDHAVILPVHDVSDCRRPGRTDQDWPSPPVPSQSKAETDERKSRKGDNHPGPQRLIEGDGNAECAEQADDREGSVAGDQRKPRGDCSKQPES